MEAFLEKHTGGGGSLGVPPKKVFFSGKGSLTVTSATAGALEISFHLSTINWLFPLCLNLIVVCRLERYIANIASLDRWLVTIGNYGIRWSINLKNMAKTLVLMFLTK